MPIRVRVLLVFLPLGCAGVWLFVRWIEQCDRGPKNYSLIEDGLYMGGDVTEPPPGVRAVVNLCEKPDPYRTEVMVWEPIADRGPAPSITWLRWMVDVVDTERRARVPTYVHCRQGVSRSGMVVVAYEMYKNHWARDEALVFVRSRRPDARPNPAFMDRLLEWERVLPAQAAENRP
jgi:Dual specificity phosphatase, catalytic domain